MAYPFILITTHRVEAGQEEALKELGRAFAVSIDANEPDALDFQLLMSDDGEKLTHVLVQRDADAMDRHFQVSGELIGRSLALAPTTAIYAFGEPGPILQRVLASNAADGVPVSVQSRRIGGLTRLAAAA
jgi:hypothetical protein